MSRESAVRFLKEMVTNEQAKKLLQAKAPKNAEESLKAYSLARRFLRKILPPPGKSWRRRSGRIRRMRRKR